MKKRDIIIIAAVLAVAVLGMAAVRFFSPKGDSAYLRVYVNDQVYREVSLDEDQVIEIDQGSGVVNHVEIQDGAARMLDSTCPDQLCVGFGDMSVDNYEDRPLRNWTVCLPNQVALELVLDSEAGG